MSASMQTSAMQQQQASDKPERKPTYTECAAHSRNLAAQTFRRLGWNAYLERTGQASATNQTPVLTWFGCQSVG